MLFAAAAASALAEDAQAPLVGSLDSGVYASPTGAFRIEVPVLRALGGAVSDTANVVTFHDNFGTQISVGAFAQDATQRWEMSTRGTKEYLIYFFSSFVLADFKHFCAGTRIESAGFSPDLEDGALFTYLLLPGGSMFQQDAAFGDPGVPPVAKRGNLTFVKNGFTFVISTELSERITEGSAYKKTPDEEDELLRNRLVSILKKMEIGKPAAK
jgi:hypothetical protein